MTDFGAKVTDKIEKAFLFLTEFTTLVCGNGLAAKSMAQLHIIPKLDMDHSPELVTIPDYLTTIALGTTGVIASGGVLYRLLMKKNPEFVVNIKYNIYLCMDKLSPVFGNAEKSVRVLDNMAFKATEYVTLGLGAYVSLRASINIVTAALFPENRYDISEGMADLISGGLITIGAAYRALRRRPAPNALAGPVG